MVMRAPCAALRPFIEVLWASNGNTQLPTNVTRQLTLPTGLAHIVLHAFRQAEIEEQKRVVAAMCE